MITIDKVTYRNLQEQVQKNKEDIEQWQNVEFTLNNFGIKVLGKIDSESDIPAGTYEFGDAYLVGLTEPYNLYIYTRIESSTSNGIFVNVGPLNVVGQQGPQGPAGQNGVDGYAPVVRYGNGLPIVESTDKNGYLYIDQQTSKLYTYNNGWNYVIDMKGQQGQQGPQGVQGATGTTLSIVSKLSSPSLLPTNFASGQIPKNSAYLVDVNGVNHLYIIIGDQADYSTWYWLDVGDFNLGSVLYKDEVFQSSINVTDSYNTNTGAVVTDTATNNMNNDLKAQIGDLATLGTTDKSSLVNAINEVKSNAGGGSGRELLWSGDLNITRDDNWHGIGSAIDFKDYNTFEIELVLDDVRLFKSQKFSESSTTVLFSGTSFISNANLIFGFVLNLDLTKSEYILRRVETFKYQDSGTPSCSYITGNTIGGYNTKLRKIYGVK